MIVQVLGCSGAIAAGSRTTSFLVDDDVLIDAGTGVGDLSLEALARIDHIFISHSHLDHVLAIGLLADSVMRARRAAGRGPIQVHALPETLAALREQFAARERTERQAAVQALFGAEFAAAPDKAAPYLAMTVEQFAAVKVAVEAERASRLPPGFTVEQAKGGPGGALTAAAITECRAKHPGMTWEQAFAALKHSGGASAPATFAG